MEISLTKNLERKKKEQIKGRINSRRPIFNPTIQLVVVNLYTTYEVSILNGCGDGRNNWKERKKKQTKGRTNSWMPISNPTIQLVLVDLYTKYEVSILNGCGDIFDEKLGKKEKGTNTKKNKQENAHLQSHNTTCPCGPVYQIWSFYLKRLWRYLWRKSVTELRKDGLKDGRNHGQI